MSWFTNSTVYWSQVLAFLIDCALKGFGSLRQPWSFL